MVRARDERLITAFAQTLRTARRDAGLTQEALAAAAALDRSFIGFLEGGRRQPTLSVIVALAAALGISPSELIQKTIRAAE